MVRRLQRILAMLTAFAVLFCDIAVPSFAEDAPLPEPVCGLAEHVHTEDCWQAVLTCGQEESAPRTERIFTGHFQAHQHSPECSDGNGNLICGIRADDYLHTHNSYCYDEAGDLVCGLEERFPHEHTEDCWEEQQLLICGQEENEEHTHDDSCVETVRVLTCGLAHRHSSACYNESGMLICGEGEIPEFICSGSDWTENIISSGHHHTELCYSRELTCTLEEHSHTEECYAKPEAEQPEENPEDPAEEQPAEEQPAEEQLAENPAENPAEEQPAENPQDEEPAGTPAEEPENIPGNENAEEVSSLAGEMPEQETEPNPENGIQKEVPAGPEPDTGTEKEAEGNGLSAGSEGETGEDAASKQETDPAEQHTEGETVPTDRETADDGNDGNEDDTPGGEPAELTAYPQDPEAGEPAGETAGEPAGNTPEEIFSAPDEQDEQGPPAAQENPENPGNPEEAEEPIDEETARLIESYLQQREDGKIVEDEPREEENRDSADALGEDSQNPPEDPPGRDPAEQTAGGDLTGGPEEEPSREPAEISLSSAEDAPYAVTAVFPADSGIPEGTALVVSEALSGAETDTGIREDAQMLRKTAAKSAGMLQTGRSETAAEAESRADIPSLTSWESAGETPGILLYNKTLEICLAADGEPVEVNPETQITVTVILPGIEAGQHVEVRHLTDEGSELLESKNDAGAVTFITNSFSHFSFTSTAQKITSWTSDLLENTLFGRSKEENVDYSVIQIDENSVPDGFSILEAFSTTQSNNLWLMIQRIKDLVLGKLESIALYAVEDGKLVGLVKENVGITDILRLNLGNYSSFALVRDSGLRNRIEELENVILSGLMPKNGVAEATDVTEEYADFLGGRGVSIDREADEEQGGLGGSKQGETDGETHTIAAYDISITNDGEEYQPEDKPITVSIQDDQIATAVANGNAISLWHVIDENNAVRVENFTIDGDTVTFSATGFSVYVITETTVEKILTAADGNVYKITVTYDGSAQIPEGAELVVTEVAEDQYLASTATALGVDESYLFYRKFLDISFRVIDENGERIIEPVAPVKVKIELLDIEAGADQLKVVHFGADGTEEVKSQVADGTVFFESKDFSVYGFGNALESIDTVETESASVEILGFESGTQLASTDTPEVEEGLEVLGAYSLEEAGKVWIKAELKEGVELADLESVAIYSISSDETDRQNVVELAGMDTITELPTTEFAVVKDSGYRHLSFNLTPDEEGTKTIALDGMMPKMATAEAMDVTAAYADHEYVVPEEEKPEPKQPAETGTIDIGEELPEEADVEGQPTRTTLAAFDITISNNESEYQPDSDHPIAVVISDYRITTDKNIELWHIKDDGSEERVEKIELSDGRIEFIAYGFSVYAVIIHEDGTVKNPRVMFHFIEDGAEYETDGTNAYYIGTPYEFKNTHGDIQTTQILSNGESLELIKDPGNQQTRYFYGWYVVTPFPITGTTDEYGIRTSDSKLYFTWPATPESVSFNRTISITSTNVQIGDPVGWNLGNVSETGIVDKDGNVHVFLAPVFEKYNFVNFMQYPWKPGSSTSSNVMTRKLIALGSSTEVDVKISDIRSTSNDPVHLIFIGWAYNAGTEENPDWHEYQTVEYTGAEMIDPGRDGVYLGVNLADRSSVDLYPIFVQARWVNYDPGKSGNGAVYVPSTFRESWGSDPSNPPAGMTANPEKNVFTHMVPSSRTGYIFGGWYAYAVVDSDTGEITNLANGTDIDTTYITSANDAFQQHDYTLQSQTAIQITNGLGDVVYNGSFDVNGYTLFSGDGSALKLYDSLDRLTLYARWIPDNSKITIVYWTQNAQNDNYTASAAKTVYTSDLSIGLGRNITSGSTITLEDLKNYTDVDYNVGIVSREILDDVGAVPATPEQDPNGNVAIIAREEIFFDLKEDSLSDISKVIDGQGNTIFNVYFSRKIFKLVFHIGRDGYVKNAGRQKSANDNWLEWMYKDPAVTAVLGREGSGSKSYTGLAHMTYNGVTYDSNYVTNANNILKDYVPDTSTANDQNLYIIEAKYGEYIGDRWPSPVNSNFTFDTITAPEDNKVKTPYIWTAYYDSLYYRNSTKRDNAGNSNNNNPDINGIYNYMSGDLCADWTGTQLINSNQVHHLVCYFGENNNNNRFKKYHILKEFVEGLELPDGTELNPGTDYSEYVETEWSKKFTTESILAHKYYELSDESPTPVISNLGPQFQLGPQLEGYNQVYSCYDPDLQPETPNSTKMESHIYFFYTPKSYKLQFMYESGMVEKEYFYGTSIANALDGLEDPEKEGYYFKGWYTNEAGEGDPFDFNITMPAEGIVLYPVMKPLQYTVKIDPNGGVIDHRVNTSYSTYFTANYGTTVGEYTVNREYIKLNEKELTPGDPTYYNGTKYYYINTQFLGESHEGDWGYPPELRNAVYVAEDQLDTYYSYYSNTLDNADLSYWAGIEKLSKPEFVDKYTSYPYRPIDSNSEHYSFMGWYEVYSDGSIASMPFDFNNPVIGELTLRAQWRLDGGYYIQYNPYFFHDDGQGNITVIVGEMEKWQDPDPNYQLYADQAPTQILRAPTNTTPGWVFRGWRVVKENGSSTYTDDEGNTRTFTVWEPIDNQNIIYYQPGEDFVIDSSLVSQITNLGSIIHMQAYYEPENNSERRPLVTNLILDSNDTYGSGYINTTDSSGLPPLSGPGYSSINTTTELYNGNPTQIKIGDFQSNIALHLYQYATTKEFNSIAGTNFFKTDSPYMLIGFDENADPENPSTSEAYVPAFSPDSVIAVTRNDSKTLYAMWEPMIYVTFVNATDESIDVTLDNRNYEMIRIVNEVTGEYDRKASSNEFSVPAHEQVKIVLPKATPGSDKITATALNDHYQKRMSVKGELDMGPNQPRNPDGTGCDDIPYGYTTTFTEGTLRLSPYSLIITYTEVLDMSVDFDVNGGTWTEASQDYVLGTEGLYSIESAKIIDNKYEPAKPTHPNPDKAFIGWTTNPDIAAHTDFTGTHSVTWGDTVIDITGYDSLYDAVMHEFIWDFSDDPPYEMILYAVYSDVVTVTFDLTKSGSDLHNWTGPATTNAGGLHVFYRIGPDDQCVTYKLLPGEKVPKPSDPAAASEPDWCFISWLTIDEFTSTTKLPNEAKIKNNTYDFSSPVTENKRLYTSWVKSEPQTYTFIVENHVVNGNSNDEFTYTINIPKAKVWGKRGTSGSNSVGDADTEWGTFSFDLKNNQQCTVLITVKYMRPGTWDACSVEVDVRDSNGISIKNGQVTFANKNGNPRYVGGYKYSLSISQAEKEGYETAIALTDDYGVFTENSYSLDESSYLFQFRSTWGSLLESNAGFKTEFTPSSPVNGYPVDKDGKITNTDQLDNGLTISFTNTRNAEILPAPTNFSSRYTPFLILLLFGLMLLIGGGVVMMRRRVDDPDDGGTVACTPTNTGPPGGQLPPVTMEAQSKPTQVNTVHLTTHPTNSTTDAESHIRWRNSVWVEERANGSIPPNRPDVSCPQAKLWMNGGGGAG